MWAFPRAPPAVNAFYKRNFWSLNSNSFSITHLSIFYHSIGKIQAKVISLFFNPKFIEWLDGTDYH
jgi:hypothetical protein